MLIVVNYKFSTVLPQNHRLFTCLHCMQGSFALAPDTGSNTPYRSALGRHGLFGRFCLGWCTLLATTFDCLETFAEKTPHP